MKNPTVLPIKIGIVYQQWKRLQQFTFILSFFQNVHAMVNFEPFSKKNVAIIMANAPPFY